MGKARAVEEVTGAAYGDQQTAVPLELRYRISPAGETIVDLGGELDMATAEMAVSYVRDVINRHRRPVIVDLTTLAFCDARGLAGLVRMAGYAEQMGCGFQLSSPSRSLVKIMRITGLERRFLTVQLPGQTGHLRLPPAALPPDQLRRAPLLQLPRCDDCQSHPNAWDHPRKGDEAPNRPARIRGRTAGTLPL